jgi:hypothetical protein
VEIDWIHRPSGPDATDGTLNICFNALDRHVVRGRADQVALRVDRLTAGRTELTYARLLEEVAAFGGVLRILGVETGERVTSRLPMGLRGLVAALAAARLGAVHEVAAPSGSEVPRAPEAPGTKELTEDLDWDLLMRAGRTDPAPVVEVPVTAPAFVVEGRPLTVGEVLEGADGSWPLDALATLLDGGIVLLSLP